MAGSGRHVALMRGINVGGKNKLPMRDLAAIFTDAGCTDVETYIQSGNVLFTASPALAKTIAADVEQAVNARFHIHSPVITRSAQEIATLLRAEAVSTLDTTILHAAFLATRPALARIKALDPDRSPGDTFQVIGREILLSLPNGVARTKLTNAYFDSALATRSTMRNWRTVTRLGQMLGADA